MANYNGEEKCAPMIWVTLAGDVHNEVLVEQKVKLPEPQQMFDDLVDCMSEATDDRVRKLGAPETWYDTAEKLVNEGPWQVHTDDQATLLLYKLWYDSITLRMGVKPQVVVHSQQKPYGMPNHWVHVYKAPKIQWSYDAEQDVMYNDDDGVRIEYMHPDTKPQCLFEDLEDDEKNAPIPAPQQNLPWYHPQWVPEVPYWNQATRKSKRIRPKVQRLTYNHQGQYFN